MDRLLELDKTLTLAVNGCHSSYWDDFFYAYTQTAVWIPLLLFLAVLIIKQWRMNGLWVILFIGLSILVADQISSSLIKPFAQRLRPTHDPELASVIHTVHGYTGGLYGFLSSHAANTFAVVTFTALIFKRVGYTVSFYIWAFLTAWSRVYLGVHYVGDVVCGAILGSIIGILLYFVLVYFTPFCKRNNPHSRLYPLFNILLICALVVNVFVIAVFC